MSNERTTKRNEVLQLIGTDAAASLRSGAIIHHLYPVRVTPATAAEVEATRRELIECLGALHFADLWALRDMVHVLANDHDGARWASQHTRKMSGDFLARMRRTNARGSPL